MIGFKLAQKRILDLLWMQLNLLFLSHVLILSLYATNNLPQPGFRLSVDLIPLISFEMCLGSRNLSSLRKSASSAKNMGSLFSSAFRPKSSENLN